MPQTYTLTKDNYLYSFIDINTFDADRDNPPLKLAITTAGKTTAMFSSDNPIIINSDDKLIVHGTEISQSDRQTLAKKLYFTGKTLIYKPGWVSGNGYFFFGVNCDGCPILCVPQARETPTLVTKFDIPFTFDWSEYNVKVPDSPLTKKQSEVDGLIVAKQKLEQELQEKEGMMTKLEQEAARSKELEDKESKLKQELEEMNEKLKENESRMNELNEQISAIMQQQEEKNINLEKLSLEISSLKLLMKEKMKEIKEKDRKNDELEGKLGEKEQLLEENELKMRQELDGKNKELEEKESKVKSLEEKQWILMREYEEKNREMENEIACLNYKLSTLMEQIEGNDNKMLEKEAEINELRGKLQGKENKLETESIVELEKGQIQKINQEINKEEEKKMEKLKEQLAILELEMEKKKAKIIELEQQLQEKDEKITKSDFQLVTNKLDKLLTTLQRGNLPPTLLQQLPIAEVVKSRLCRFVPDKFTISAENLPQFTEQPQFRVSMKNLRVFTPIDEKVDGKFPKEEICVYTSDHRFHSNEWWYIKVAEHSNITMLGFYDGDMDQVCVHGNYVPIPFRPETIFSSNRHFFVGLICGIGLRFMFMYELINYEEHA